MRNARREVLKVLSVLPVAMIHLLSLYPYSYEPLPVWKEPLQLRDASELMQRSAAVSIVAPP
jgi:hypothetical protein